VAYSQLKSAEGVSFFMSDYSELEDSQLIQMAKDDTAAFGELYERHVRRIYNYIYYRTSNAQDAEDLTAKVFMRALNHVENYDERGVPFTAWLYRIAHNLVANWYRDRSRRKIIPLDEFVEKGMRSELPEVVAEQQEEQDRMLESIQRLPSDRQQLLILKYVERMSNAEIGEIMGKTEGAVKSLYYRTLSFLREDMSHDAPQQRVNEE
jgi:RNA polymerase sigma-70 factor (ECF subfamily)